MLEPIVKRLNRVVDHIGPQVFYFTGNQLKLMLEVRVTLRYSILLMMLKIHPPIAFEFLYLLLQPAYFLLILLNISRQRFLIDQSLNLHHFGSICEV